MQETKNINLHDIKDFNLSIIYTRDDGSYVINKGLYHVPNEGEWTGLWTQINTYIKDNPEVLKHETIEHEQQFEEVQDIKLTKAKEERSTAVSSITIEVDGMIFDGDEKSQERMARAITAATATGASMDETTTWVLHDNTIAHPTIKQLAIALRKAGEAQTALWTKPYES